MNMAKGERGNLYDEELTSSEINLLELICISSQSFTLKALISLCIVFPEIVMLDEFSISRILESPTVAINTPEKVILVPSVIRNAPEHITTSLIRCKPHRDGRFYQKKITRSAKKIVM